MQIPPPPGPEPRTKVVAGEDFTENISMRKYKENGQVSIEKLSKHFYFLNFHILVYVLSKLAKFRHIFVKFASQNQLRRTDAKNYNRHQIYRLICI